MARGREGTGEEYRAQDGQVERDGRTAMNDSLHSRRNTNQPDAKPERDFSKVIGMTTP
jgi:hypothetical protein